jgi:hypothetical protein
MKLESAGPGVREGISGTLGCPIYRGKVGGMFFELLFKSAV